MTDQRKQVSCMTPDKAEQIARLVEKYLGLTAHEVETETGEREWRVVREDGYIFAPIEWLNTGDNDLRLAQTIADHLEGTFDYSYLGEVPQWKFAVSLDWYIGQAHLREKAFADTRQDAILQAIVKAEDHPA